MEVLLSALAMIYTGLGLRYLVRSVSTVPGLLYRGKRHPAAVLARVRGVPEWAIQACLMVAAAAAVLTAIVMASLWPLVLLLERLIERE